MEYVVIKGFTDAFTGERYAVGERYPRRGFVKKERANELSSSNNKRGIPLIAAKESKSEEVAEKKVTKTDISRMNKETLVEKAKEIGVENAEEMSGSALKDKLVEYYGL